MFCQSGHVLPERSCFWLLSTGTQHDQLQCDDDKKALTDVVTRLVNEEYGDKKFVGIQNGRPDVFILLLLLESNVILQDFADKLNDKYHIMLV